MKNFQKTVPALFEYMFHKLIWKENEVLLLKDKFGHELKLELHLLLCLKSVLKHVPKGNCFYQFIGFQD